MPVTPGHSSVLVCFAEPMAQSRWPGVARKACVRAAISSVASGLPFLGFD